ncbi:MULTISPECIES: hypothetical protein [unclassified Streptomyces]|uniref:hypothetical protein n=1 Tax=unclassified Streptomyces TaxID=2593676 RepID=UPI003319133C
MPAAQMRYGEVVQLLLRVQVVGDREALEPQPAFHHGDVVEDDGAVLCRLLASPPRSRPPPMPSAP